MLESSLVELKADCSIASRSPEAFLYLSYYLFKDLTFTMKTASHLRLGLVASLLGCLSSMISSSRNTPAFASFPVATRQLSSSFSGARFVKVNRAPASRSTMKSELNMFMGSDGGILGIGTPELVRSYHIYIFTYICCRVPYLCSLARASHLISFCFLFLT